MKSEDDLIEQAYQMRLSGDKWPMISAAVGLPSTTIVSHLRRRPKENESVVVRRLITHGLSSSEKSYVHYIQMPRVTFIDGKYKPSNDNNVATALSA